MRERIGLRLFKPSWCFYRSEFGADDWKILESGDIAKRIQRDQKTGLLQWEEDYYYSGKSYKTINGVTDWERLTIHYDYLTNLLQMHYSGEDNAMSRAYGDIDDRHANRAEIMKTADAILERWGMARL